MKKNIKVNDELSIEVVEKRNRTITYIYENGEKKVLTDIKTDDYFWSKVVFDENYVVVYSRGCMVNQIPLNVEAAYDIKEKRMLNLFNEKLKVLLEYMFICTKGFELTNVLSFINKVDLKILEEEEKDDLKRILTSGNSKISDEDVIKYILNKYPILEKYKDLKSPLTVIEYNKIKDEIGQDIFRFHIMPQSLKFVENINIEDTNVDNRNYNQIYVSEYENHQKVLKRIKTNK